jgi:hypothetical protein
MKNILLFLIIVFCKIPLNAQVNVMPAFQAIQYNVGIIATGGTITTVGNYKVHTFNSSGTFTINKATVIEILVVAGGGSGGEGHGGGGGAGGMIYKSSFAILGQSYSVIVGNGGAASQTGNNSRGYKGDNSVFSTLTSIGGGYGSTWEGGDGGSGGGSSCWVIQAYPASLTTGSGKGIPGQGNDGGPVFATIENDGPGQGGGGSGGIGKSGSGLVDTNCKGGDGGVGLTCSISGTLTTYAGGGGGGGSTGVGVGGVGGGGNGGLVSQNSTTGMPNTGGGGGGGGAMGTGTARFGAAGGSGIVIIRYRYR